MWRPENWENPEKGKPLLNYGRSVIKTEDIYEAGADAMLEAIKARSFISGESLRNVKGAIGWASINPDSKWYSIPDEEGNDAKS